MEARYPGINHFELHFPSGPYAANTETTGSPPQRIPENLRVSFRSAFLNQFSLDQPYPALPQSRSSVAKCLNFSPSSSLFPSGDTGHAIRGARGIWRSPMHGSSPSPPAESRNSKYLLVRSPQPPLPSMTVCSRYPSTEKPFSSSAHLDSAVAQPLTSRPFSPT